MNKDELDFGLKVKLYLLSELGWYRQPPRRKIVSIYNAMNQSIIPVRSE